MEPGRLGQRAAREIQKHYELLRGIDRDLAPNEQRKLRRNLGLLRERLAKAIEALAGLEGRYDEAIARQARWIGGERDRARPGNPAPARGAP